MENLLFNVDEIKPLKPENRCRNCMHIYKHEYGKMKYCAKKFDKTTAYGNKKIKANDAACSMFAKMQKIRNE